MRLIGVVAGLVAIGLVAFFVLRFANPPNALPPCQPAAGEDSVACSTIDGLWIGPIGTECTLSPAPCDPEERLAITGIDARDPGHAAIARVRRYGLDMSRVCGPRLCTYSGRAPSIWVFDLADDSRHAIETQCPGVALQCEILPPLLTSAGRVAAPN